jgi:hypothetical protein
LMLHFVGRLVFWLMLSCARLLCSKKVLHGGNGAYRK